MNYKKRIGTWQAYQCRNGMWNIKVFAMEPNKDIGCDGFEPILDTNIGILTEHVCKTIVEAHNHELLEERRKMKVIEVKNCRECCFLLSDEDGLYPECHITGDNLKNIMSNRKHVDDYTNSIHPRCPLLKKTYQVILASNINIYKEE